MIKRLIDERSHLRSRPGYERNGLFTTVKIYCSIGAAIGSCNFETPAFQSGEQSLEVRKRNPAQLNPGTDALRWPRKVRSLL
jgi:hypothetical protein